MTGHPQPNAGITSAALDELLWRLGNAMRDGRLDQWGFDFARSVLRQAKRPGWWPSAKQIEIMNRLLRKKRRPNESALIDDGDEIRG